MNENIEYNINNILFVEELNNKVIRELYKFTKNSNLMWEFTKYLFVNKNHKLSKDELYKLVKENIVDCITNFINKDIKNSKDKIKLIASLKLLTIKGDKIEEAVNMYIDRNRDRIGDTLSDSKLLLNLISKIDDPNMANIIEEKNIDKKDDKENKHGKTVREEFLENLEKKYGKTIIQEDLTVEQIIKEVDSYILSLAGNLTERELENIEEI